MGFWREAVDFGVTLWFAVRDFCSSVVEGCCMYWLSSSTNKLVGLCNFMARIPNKIRSSDGSKEALKLAVRITDLWFVGTPDKSEQAEMVFVDSEGDQIHAICKSDHLKSWKADLKENCTYVMHNFKVVKNDGQFRVCEHEYKLFFIGVTVVREADLHELPFKEFRFVEFANVVAGNFVSGLLVGEYSHNLCFHFDHNFFGFFSMTYFHFWWFKILLGSLIRWSFGMFHRKIPGVYIVKNSIFHFAWCLCLCYPYEVMDVMLFLCCSGEILSCTLWENYCAQFLSYLNERGDDGPMVIILTHARIKDAQGSYPASVSNSFKASKLLINDPILEIQEFKERLLDLGVEVSRVLLPGDQASSQVSGGSQLSSKDSFLSKAEAKTILEINAISEDAVCVTVGTISKIVMDNHSWCYPACAQCHRKTDIQIGPFICGCGKDNDQPVLRYRVEVMVTQNNKSGKFLLWDRECAELIGQTADDVNRVKIEDGDLDLNASPQALDKLLGHVLALKVRIQSRFKNAVVLKYSKDLDLINVVLEMLADTNHDPIAGLPLTPKKRMSSDEANDGLGSSQISSAQLSTINMQRDMVLQKPNYQHAKRCDSVKATTNRKLIVSDSSESENSESTQGSGSNFMTPFEDCQSPTNQPVINTEGYSDLGDQLIQCSYCNAQMWYDERISKNKNFENPRFSLCCGNGKVELPLLQNPPEYLQQLLFHDDTIDSKNYQHNLRAYNMMFAFTSAGIKLDKTINNSRGPLTIRIQGQPCHRIGSLLPIQYSGIQNHIVSALSHMLHQHNSYAQSFRMARDRLAADQANNIKLQLIVARGKDGRTKKETLLLKLKMENYKESMNFILAMYHYNILCSFLMEKTDIELTYFIVQKKKAKPSDKREWFAYRLQSRSNEAQTLLHSRKLFQQFIVEGYTMVESERLSYIRNNQKKLRIDKYSSLQTSLDTGTAKGLTKGKRVILPSTFVGSPRYMDQLYFDSMEICSHVGFPNLFITLTCNPNWPEIHRLLSPLNLKPTDSLPINADEQKTIYHRIIQAVNNNEGGMFFLYGFGGTGKTFIWRTLASSLRAENQIVIIVASSGIASLLLPGGRTAHSRFKIPKTISDYAILCNDYKQVTGTITIHGWTLFAETSIHSGQLYVALSRVNSAKGLKILIQDDEQKSMNSTTNIRYPIVRPPAIMQFRVAFHNNQRYLHFIINNGHPITHTKFGSNTMEQPTQYGSNNTEEDIFLQMDSQRKNAPPLQWDVVTLDRSIKDKSIVRPWYKFLKENDFHHEDEVSFYYRPHERI
ncbi:Replication protein A DNA-binding subunit B [Glycine soja]